VPDADGRVLGIPQVAAVTCLVAAVMTILMGVVGRYPFAIATGLGLNAFVTFSVASQMSWADAMGLVVLEGIVIAVLVLVGLRTAVFHAIPMQLKTAISVGIGLFIALIGLVDAGFVRRTDVGPVPVQLGVGGDLRGWPTVVFVIGLLLTAVLVARRTRGAILIGIVVTTLVAIVVEAIFDIGPSFISPEESNPKGWQLNVPTLRTRSSTPEPVAAGRLLAVRRLRAGRGARRAAARLHVDAGGLLRHDGHGRRRRPGGGPARRGGPPAGRRPGAARRLAGRRRRWCRLRVV
jgi:xanthine/uracil/vitamin C permease (AzgA family)